MRALNYIGCSSRLDQLKDHQFLRTNTLMLTSPVRDVCRVSSKKLWSIVAKWLFHRCGCFCECLKKISKHIEIWHYENTRSYGYILILKVIMLTEWWALILFRVQKTFSVKGGKNRQGNQFMLRASYRSNIWLKMECTLLHRSFELISELVRIIRGVYRAGSKGSMYPF